MRAFASSAVSCRASAHILEKQLCRRNGQRRERAVVYFADANDKQPGPEFLVACGQVDSRKRPS